MYLHIYGGTKPLNSRTADFTPYADSEASFLSTALARLKISSRYVLEINRAIAVESLK